MRTADIQEREQIRLEDATERTRMRHEDVVLRGLEYLTGKTQRRNVGIAILELHWDETKHVRPVVVPVLVNQAVYLLEQSEQVGERHEADNLRRIMSLLVRALAGSAAASADYRSLLDSLDRRLEAGGRGEPPDRDQRGEAPERGLRLKLKTLEEWRAAVHAGLGAPPAAPVVRL